MMKRRDFSRHVLAAGVLGSLGAGLGAGAPAWAQGAPVEGKQYLRLSQPLPVTPGKIEVVEFFWYGCPHCNAFEPMLEAWVGKLPADVVFKRVPVAFREVPFVAHQKIYYTLEALGLVAQLQAKVFQAIHVDHKRLDKPSEIEAFAKQNGLDAKKFMDVFNSFAVQSKAKQASKLAEAWHIDGVPALGIQGRYLTSGSQAGSLEGSLQVADYLIERVRKGGA
jgi:thiol:disulfide interchange protein DsbA